MNTAEKSTRICHCDWLKNAANDPRFPIEYDAQSNTFKLQCQLGDGNLGYAVLNYCPFCAGLAPDLRKEKIFTHISEQERQRLQEITRQIKSIEDAFRILGEPDPRYAASRLESQMESQLLESQISEAENELNAV